VKESKLKTVDPLNWWRDNHHAYPAVWELAEKYLAIPASSAASERAFSSAGNIITVRRCRLKAALVDGIVMLRENIEALDIVVARRLAKYDPA